MDVFFLKVQGQGGAREMISVNARDESRTVTPAGGR